MTDQPTEQPTMFIVSPELLAENERCARAQIEGFRAGLDEARAAQDERARRIDRGDEQWPPPSPPGALVLGVIEARVVRAPHRGDEPRIA